MPTQIQPEPEGGGDTLAECLADIMNVMYTKYPDLHLLGVVGDQQRCVMVQDGPQEGTNQSEAVCRLYETILSHIRTVILSTLESGLKLTPEQAEQLKHLEAQLNGRTSKPPPDPDFHIIY